MSTITNGNAGVNRVVARLTMACHANVRQGSYSEDSNKCDILFTYQSAFDQQELCELAGQVKTGDSFYEVNKNQTTARIDNCSDVKSIMIKQGLPIVIFINSTNNSVYWYSGDFRSKQLETIKIPITQVIVPSIWIDYSRMYRYWQYPKNRYLTQTMSSRELSKDYIKSCKQSFKKYLKSPIINPISGEIYVTNKAWEHITRKSRPKIARQRSVRVAKHLAHFLSRNPDRMDLKNMVRKEVGELIHETREIIFYYRNGILYNNTTLTFAVRINELIIYPKNWNDCCLSIEMVQHKRKVASWWVK